jgi:hypothetical protein
MIRGLIGVFNSAMDRWLCLAACFVLSGCALGRSERATAPVSIQAARGPISLHADFALDQQDRVLDDLTNLRRRVLNALDLPYSPQPIQVYLFGSAERYHAMLAERFPGFPVRRAFFVKQGGQFEIYAQWSDRTAEDLRHEATHAFLHASVGDLPLWLDEGLAEFFETPVEAAGWNAPHADFLRAQWRAGRWRPDLRRLESLPSSAELAQVDYAEAWAWTYLLLGADSPRRPLLVSRLRAHGRGEPTARLVEALARAEPAPQDALLAVLDSDHERQSSHADSARISPAP